MRYAALSSSPPRRTHTRRTTECALGGSGASTLCCSQMQRGQYLTQIHSRPVTGRTLSYTRVPSQMGYFHIEQRRGLAEERITIMACRCHHRMVVPGHHWWEPLSSDLWPRLWYEIQLFFLPPCYYGEVLWRSTTQTSNRDSQNACCRVRMCCSRTRFRQEDKSVFFARCSVRKTFRRTSYSPFSFRLVSREQLSVCGAMRSFPFNAIKSRSDRSRSEEDIFPSVILELLS